jgi:hypothetical protein
MPTIEENAIRFDQNAIAKPQTILPPIFAMSVNTNTEVIQKGKINLMTISAKRLDEGILIKIKSPKIEAMMRTLLATPNNPTFNPCLDTDNQRAYRMLNTKNVMFTYMKNNYSCDLNSWGQRLDYEGNFNFSCLRAIGLSEGVELLYRGLYESLFIRNWLNQSKEISKVIYRDYLSPIDIEISVEIKETSYV